MSPTEFTPVLLVAVPLAGTGLIALTRTHTRVDRAEKDIADKADKAEVAGLDKRLDRMETKIDRLVERDLPR